MKLLWYCLLHLFCCRVCSFLFFAAILSPLSIPNSITSDYKGCLHHITGAHTQQIMKAILYLPDCMMPVWAWLNHILYQCHSMILSKFGVQISLCDKWPTEVILVSGWDCLIHTSSCRNPHGVPMETSSDTSPRTRLQNKILV